MLFDKEGYDPIQRVLTAQRSCWLKLSCFYEIWVELIGLCKVLFCWDIVKKYVIVIRWHLFGGKTFYQWRKQPIRHRDAPIVLSDQYNTLFFQLSNPRDQNFPKWNWTNVEFKSNMSNQIDQHVKEVGQQSTKTHIDCPTCFNYRSSMITSLIWIYSQLKSKMK